MKSDVTDKTLVKVFRCTKGNVNTAGFIVVGHHVAHHAPILHLTDNQDLDSAMKWLEARNWHVERIDVGK